MSGTEAKKENDDIRVAKLFHKRFYVEIWREARFIKRPLGGYYAMIGKSSGTYMKLLHIEPVRSYQKALSDALNEIKRRLEMETVNLGLQPQNTRLSYRLNEVAQATGLSLPFLRKEAREGKLKTRKIGGAVIVLTEDLLTYLKGDDSKDTSTQ